MQDPDEAPGALDYWLNGFALFWMVLGALFGGAVATAIIATCPAFGAASARSPLMIAWMVLLAAEGAIAWAGALPAMGAAWYAGKAVRRAEPRNVKWVAFAVIAIVAVVVLGQVIAPSVAPLTVAWPLGDEHRARMAIATGFILLPPLAAIASMWLLAIRSVNDACTEGAKGEVLVARHLELREQIQGLLWYVGIVIGGAVLATGVLRQAMLGGAFADPDAFPAALVLAYGAFFTLLLVISYVPAHLILQHAGKHVLAAVLPPAKDGNILAWQKDRGELVKLLRLDSGVADSLKNSIAILAPILAGLASMALPK